MNNLLCSCEDGMPHDKECKWFKLGETLAQQFRQDLERHMSKPVEERIKEGIKLTLRGIKEKTNVTIY